MMVKKTMAQLKTNITNYKEQSTFLPKIQKAETEIKKLILTFAFLYKSKSELRLRIKTIIKKLNESLSDDVIDKKLYIDGLFKTSERMIKRYYDKIINTYLITVGVLLTATEKRLVIENPKELYTYIKKSSPSERDLWSAKKGSSYIDNYTKKINEYVNGTINTKTTVGKNNQTKLSIYQKAEMDIRYREQMKMLDETKNKTNLAWTSTHPDCSKRCEPWQGKLFDLTGHSNNKNFKMNYTIDGHDVYSLTDVMNQVDKYGYKNNIICGFNCRHKLIPYNNEKYGPEEYTKEEIRKERKINANLRAMEREIRRKKQRLEVDPKLTPSEKIKLKNEIQHEIDIYKEYADKNGFAWYEYRIKI